MSEFSGAPRGGNGATERGAAGGDIRADVRVEPQFEQMPGVLGEGGVDWADGDSFPWIEAFDRACEWDREWDRTDGVGVLDACVNVRVKYLCPSSVQIDMIILARIWPCEAGECGG